MYTFGAIPVPEDEFGVLTTALNKMTTDLKHRQEMLIEYAAAEDIQKGLLPSTMPSNASGALEFGNFYKSMSGVGGDYFDFMNSGEDKIAFCIGDVSNHGIGPALVMVSLRSQLQSLIRSEVTDLRKILLSLNEQVYADTPSHIFVTFFLGIYEKKTGKISTSFAILFVISSGVSFPWVKMICYILSPPNNSDFAFMASFTPSVY